jgi:hypothetical protein
VRANQKSSVFPEITFSTPWFKIKHFKTTVHFGEVLEGFVIRKKMNKLASAMNIFKADK